MADNSLRESSSTESIRTIDKGGIKVAVSVIDAGGAGTESLVATGTPLPVRAEPRISVVDASPTVLTAPYAVNDRVGGTVTLSAVAPANAATGSIIGCVMTDAVKQDAVFELWVWNAAPTGGADGDPFVANLDSTFQGIIPVSAWYAEASKGAAMADIGALPLPVKCGAAADDLYIRYVTRSAPDFAAATDLKCFLTIAWDL